MYDLMSRIRDATRQAGTDPSWHVQIRGYLGALLCIESRNSLEGDF